jgi:hypothetical protein
MRLPDDMSRAVSTPALDVRPLGRRALLIAGRPVEVAMKPDHRREFIDRLFSMPELSCIELALDSGHATLGFDPAAGSPGEVLKSLAKAMRSAKPGHFELADLELIELISRERRIGIWRAGGRLTFLRVRRLRRERYRFYHPEFRDAQVREAMLAQLMGIAYLSRQSASGIGGYIEVVLQAGRITIEHLVGIVEGALLGTIASATRQHTGILDLRRHMVNTNLALALISDFLFPPARLLSMISLWYLNVRHVKPAIRSIREGKANLDVLYCTIATLTLLSLSFIASGLMYWMFEFWPRRVKLLREAETAKFLAALKRCPRSAWVEREGAEMEVELGNVRPRETVILRVGDVAPGDGIAISGHVMVEETWTAGVHRKNPGDLIHCSARIVSGEARMRLDSLGSGAVTSTLATWHSRAIAEPVSQERVKRTATATVAPVLALTLIALTRGGVSNAKAVIRSDYVTGPHISRELGWVAAVVEAARGGIFIANDSVLEKLAQCDCFVFSPGVRWRPGGETAEEIDHGLRALGVEEVLMPMGKTAGAGTIAVLHPELGESRPVDAGGLIKERQYLGRQVAFIGDCEAFPIASSRADVAVHICHAPLPEVPPYSIALLEPGLGAVLALRQIANDYHNRLRGGFATALIPNATSLVGTFYFGLPVLAVVILTNAGTFASYLESRHAIRTASS